jgi:hypothetical protein
MRSWRNWNNLFLMPLMMRMLLDGSGSNAIAAAPPNVFQTSRLFTLSWSISLMKLHVRLGRISVVSRY